jgi:hypothetical protein
MNILDFYQTAEKREELKQLLILGAQQHPDGLPDFFLEKDLWVTEILRILFDEGLLGEFTVAFKGGTALSKCWKMIDRFSEDIDLSIHWTDLAEMDDEETLWKKTTQSGSQRKKFRDAQSQKLVAWSEKLARTLNKRLSEYEIDGLGAELEPDSKGEKINVRFPRVTDSNNGYHLDYVLLEFGGRNRGHPRHQHQITCYMSEVPALQQAGIDFPKAAVFAYAPDYIMWEKLTALHQFSTMEREPGAHRLARHWYDVDCMISRNFVDPLANNTARDNVILMKRERWPERGVNYDLASQGQLKLIPDPDRLAMIAQDHQEAITGRMFYSSQEPDSFEHITERLRNFQNKINQATLPKE